MPQPWHSINTYEQSVNSFDKERFTESIPSAAHCRQWYLEIESDIDVAKGESKRPIYH